MRYWQSYRFVFNHPNWSSNLLLASVCLLIPVVGQIVLIGYLFEVIDVLLRRHPASSSGTADETGEEAFDAQIMDALPADDDLIVSPYPEFNFNRFSEHLMRGVWPFLVQFIVGMAVGVVAGLIFVLGMVLAGVAAGAANSPWPVLLAYALALVFYAFVAFVVAILSTPLYLRAGLSCDFNSAFSMEFYRDFMKRVPRELVLAKLFVTVTGTFLIVVGLLLCYVGVFPAAVLFAYSQHHIDYQLYRLYLERGGMAVPRKETASVRRRRYDEDDAPAPHIRRPKPEDRSTDVKREEKDW